MDEKLVFNGYVDDRKCMVYYTLEYQKLPIPTNRDYYMEFSISVRELNKAEACVDNDKSGKTEIVQKIGRRGGVENYLKSPMTYKEAKEFLKENEKDNLLLKNKDTKKVPVSPKNIAKVAAVVLSLGLLVGGAKIMIDNSKNASATGIGESETPIVSIEPTLTSVEPTVVPTIEPTPIVKPIETQTSEDDGYYINLDGPYIDYDSIQCRTYEDGKYIMAEPADALLAAQKVYYNVAKELEDYKNEHGGSGYAFDITKFRPEIFVGQAVQESSLIQTELNPLKGYKGYFKIGSAATQEANEVSKKLTGKNVIETEDDCYDFVKACRAAMYISVKNYQYDYNCIKNNNLDIEITPEMVLDTYLYGCGNIMNSLKNNSYSNSNYSLKIMNYADTLVNENYLFKLNDGLDISRMTITKSLWNAESNFENYKEQRLSEIAQEPQQ